MIGSGLSVVIELIVSLLLVVTIGYCYVVNRKLTALRTDQTGLRQVVIELNRSSERAEQAISLMRRTAQAVDGDIASQREAARQARDELVEAIERSRNARAVLEKFGDLDVSQLKKLSIQQSSSQVSDRQMAAARELKRQRLGFNGAARGAYDPSVHEAEVAQHGRDERAASEGFSGQNFAWAEAPAGQEAAMPRFMSQRGRDGHDGSAADYASYAPYQKTGARAESGSGRIGFADAMDRLRVERQAAAEAAALRGARAAGQSGLQAGLQAGLQGGETAQQMQAAAMMRSQAMAAQPMAYRESA